VSTRPVNLDSFIGQEHLMANLRVLVGGAQFRQEAAPHMLFMGPPGLGKTSLAQVIATEMGSSMVSVLGTMLKREQDIASILAGLCERDVLFIDEIHAMPRKVAETLYTAVEDFYLDILMGPKNRPTPVRLNLPHFTLVGATTHPGGISGPLRDRFGFVGKLGFYEPQQLVTIIQQVAEGQRVAILDGACGVLASASRGTPRVAIKLFERARDIAQSREVYRVIDESTAQEALALAGVSWSGLDQTDQAVLSTLSASYSPMGLSTLAARLGEEESTIEAMVEPYLLRMGLIERLPNGRIITPEGRAAWADALCEALRS
jgi:holliday junction DNA helicase RuvB